MSGSTSGRRERGRGRGAGAGFGYAAAGEGRSGNIVSARHRLSTAVRQSPVDVDALVVVFAPPVPVSGTDYARALKHSREQNWSKPVVTTFLGVLLGISAVGYRNSEERFDGTLDIVEDENKKQLTLNFNGDPYELENQDEVVFKVNDLGHI